MDSNEITQAYLPQRHMKKLYRDSSKMQTHEKQIWFSKFTINKNSSGEMV